ncbi:oligopeptide/dipeptide ABC transporter ATPase [Candidatus Magnetoovum chiemensis]|nr:oligopeptide/dipeptide ABC transporter ATPase [Candidatus Magnetoovum chiemensis]
MEENVLAINNLSIYFKHIRTSTYDNRDLEVVHCLNFDVHKSEIFGIVGESGCGKSITAYSIMGILPGNAYFNGDILFNDVNFKTLNDEQMRKLRGDRLSMIFQEPMTSLNPVLTIGYQLAEVLITHRGLNKYEAQEKAAELLKAVKIPSARQRLRDYPHQLSGGMRQRVMIAMAIACNPSLLIADEPTTALDVTIQKEILNLLLKIRQEQNMSIILITHDLGIISLYTDRVAVMYAGRIMEKADTSELFKNPRHPYTIGLLNSLPKDKNIPLRPIKGVVPKPENLPEGCKFSDRCDFTIDECKSIEPELSLLNKEHHIRCIRAREDLWKMTI